MSGAVHGNSLSAISRAARSRRPRKRGEVEGAVAQPDKLLTLSSSLSAGIGSGQVLELEADIGRDAVEGLVGGDSQVLRDANFTRSGVGALDSARRHVEVEARIADRADRRDEAADRRPGRARRGACPSAPLRPPSVGSKSNPVKARWSILAVPSSAATSIPSSARVGRRGRGRARVGDARDAARTVLALGGR